MSKHEGEILKNLIKTSGKSLTEIAILSEISRPQVYNLIRDVKIADSYKEKLAKAGINIAFENKNYQPITPTHSQQTQRYLSVVEHLIRERIVENQQDFCNRTGISVSSLSLAKSGDREASTIMINTICEKFNVNRYFIYNGDLPMFIEPKITNAKEKGLVPYYDVDASAGNVTIFNDDGAEFIKQYIAVPAFQDCDMFINISGNSMYPKYCAGELIALKKITDLDVIAFGEAYLIVTAEQRLLKYIKKASNSKHWILHSENPDFDDFEIDIEKVVHLYIVKGKITKNII